MHAGRRAEAVPRRPVDAGIAQAAPGQTHGREQRHTLGIGGQVKIPVGAATGSRKRNRSIPGNLGWSGGIPLLVLATASVTRALQLLMVIVGVGIAGIGIYLVRTGGNRGSPERRQSMKLVGFSDIAVGAAVVLGQSVGLLGGAIGWALTIIGLLMLPIAATLLVRARRARAGGPPSRKAGRL
jgi:hypothetical protein